MGYISGLAVPKTTNMVPIVSLLSARYLWHGLQGGVERQGQISHPSGCDSELDVDFPQCMLAVRKKMSRVVAASLSGSGLVDGFIVSGLF